MTRAAIYARYSTDRQSESSTADQLRVCRQYAADRGFTVTDEYLDEAISGAALGNRPGVLRMMEAAIAGKLECVLVVDLTRLARSQADLPKMIDRLVHRGVRVIGIQDGYDTSRIGHKLQAGLTGIIGEGFREAIKQRTYSALEMRAKERRPTGGRAYGFTNTREQIPEQVTVLREIFNRYGAGETMHAIASDLNCRGVPSPGATWKRKERRRDGRWLTTALHAILHNELYAGRVIWNRREFRKDPDTGKRTCIERPRSHWLEHPIEPVIDPATWERCVARLGLTGGGRRGPIRYLLSGLLACGECGSRFVVYGGKQHRYACSTYRHGGEHACSNRFSVPRALAENLILSPIVDDLLAPAHVDEMAGHIRAELRREQIRPVVPAEAEQLDAQLAQLATLVESGVLTPETAGPAIEVARRKREALLRAAATRSAGGQCHSTDQIVDAYKAQVRVMRETLRGPDVNAAREVLRELVGVVRLVARAGLLWAEYGRGSFALMTGTHGVGSVVAGAGFDSIYPPVALVRAADSKGNPAGKQPAKGIP